MLAEGELSTCGSEPGLEVADPLDPGLQELSVQRRVTRERFAVEPDPSDGVHGQRQDLLAGLGQAHLPKSRALGEVHVREELREPEQLPPAIAGLPAGHRHVEHEPASSVAQQRQQTLRPGPHGHHCRDRNLPIRDPVA